MKISSYGCSFIFGTDLSDAEMIPNTPGNPSKHSWSALLADHLGYKHWCRAYPGCGNLLIAERIFLDLDYLRQHAKLVVIGWTWIDRFDYNDVNKIDNWETIRPSSDSHIGKTYYSTLHSEYRDKLTSLIAIKSVIDTLKQENIPFIMTYMDDLLFDQRWNSSNSINYLQNYVKPYMFTFEGQTFLNWSKKKGFPISETLHPLEDAHQAAFELIKSYNLV